RFTDSGLAVTIAVEPGARYRLSGWLRTEGAEARGRAPGMMLNVHGGQRTKGVRGTSDWTEVAVEFDSGDQQEIVVHCLFGGYGGATGTAFWDDVSLVKIGGGATFAGALEALASLPADATAAATPAEREFTPDPAVHERGAAVYGRTCIACHGVDGRGVPGVFPPLDGSGWLTGDPELPTKIVLRGLMGPVQVGDRQFNNLMTPLGPLLTDQEIADALTYVRQRWSNDAAAVTAAEVASVRAATENHPQMWTAAELGR
ncbi:MAG: cytochrome c, partial [Planctomycetes bacterium]|nr:cytochrome c [Planctomycetota bacterium]